MAATQAKSRNAWMVAFTARVIELRKSDDGDILVLTFPSPRDVESFRKPAAAAGAGVSEVLRSAIVQVLGSSVKFITRVESEAAESSTQDFTAAAAAATAASAPEVPAPRPSTGPTAAPAPLNERSSQNSSEERASENPLVERSAAQSKRSAPEAHSPVDDWNVVPIPGDEDAPPAEDEPPAPEPADQPPAPSGRAPSPNRYGEAVLREVLGATFIEEERN